MGVPHLLLVVAGQRLQQAVAPFVAVGEKDHAMLVRGEDDVGRLAPLAFELLKQDLDGDEPKHRAVIIMNGLGEKVAGQSRGHADAVEAATALAQRLGHIGSKAVVLAHIAVRVAPVAGGQGLAAFVDEGQRGSSAGAVGLLQLVVEPVHLGGAERVAERALEFGIERQHLGQGAVAVHALHHGLGIERELALHAFAFIVQRGLQRDATGGPHAQQHAAEHDDKGQKQSVSGKVSRKTHDESG